MFHCFLSYLGVEQFTERVELRDAWALKALNGKDPPCQLGIPHQDDILSER